MYRNPDITVDDWRTGDRREPQAERHARSEPQQPALQFNLVRSISIFGIAAVGLCSVTFALILTHFLKEEILAHDAILTSEFIGSVAETQSREASLGPNVTLGQILDERTNFAALGVDR